jgi:hypothetical protein
MSNRFSCNSWTVFTNDVDLQMIYLTMLPLWTFQGVVLYVVKTQVGVLPNGTAIPYTYWLPSQQAWVNPVSFITAVAFASEFSASGLSSDGRRVVY